MSGRTDRRVTEPRYSKWRVWNEGDGFRVCRDDYASTLKGGPRLQAQHLAYLSDPPRGPYDLAWLPHGQGDVVPPISVYDFADWLKDCC